MTLRLFHRVLIGTAILFFAGFGAYEARKYAGGSGAADLAMGLGALAAAGGLAVYLRAFLRRSPESDGRP